MKKFYLVLIVVFLSLSSCKAQIDSKNFDWKEFVSEEGKFKARFPVTPEQTIRTSPLGNGKIQHPKIEVSLPQMNFSVYYGDIPDLKNLNQDELKDYYNYLRDETIKLNNSQLINERDVSIGGKAGYEFVESRNEKIVTYRLLLVKNRNYQIKTEINLSLKNDSDVKGISERFLDSFQVIES